MHHSDLSTKSTESKLILLRHAETRANAEARWHGADDETISAAGRAEAQRAGRRLRELLDGLNCLVVTSDLRRARETANILAEAIDAKQVHTEPLLRERDIGDWVGRSPIEVEELWPGVLTAWEAGQLDGPPGGETDADVAKRARLALQTRASNLGGLSLVITHGGVIRALKRDVGLGNSAVPHLGGNLASLSYFGELTLGSEIILGSPGVKPLT